MLLMLSKSLEGTLLLLLLNGLNHDFLLILMGFSRISSQLFLALFSNAKLVSTGRRKCYSRSALRLFSKAAFSIRRYAEMSLLEICLAMNLNGLLG